MALVTVPVVEFGRGSEKAAVAYVYNDQTSLVTALNLENQTRRMLTVRFRHKTNPAFSIEYDVAPGTRKALVVPSGRFKMSMVYDEWLEQDVLACPDLDGVEASLSA